MSVRILQVGVGVRGGHWLDIIHDHSDATTVGCVDCREEALAAARARPWAGSLPCRTGLAEALREVAADAVLIATPSDLHAEHALRSLEAGLAVLTEKPLAENVSGAKAILAKAAEVGKPVIVAENYRYWRAERTIRRLVQSGVLGAISQVTFIDYRNQPSGRLPAWVGALAYPHLQEIAVHHFDSIRALLGTDAEAILARSWNPPWSDYRGFASTEALIEMKGGAHVQYYSTLSAPYFSFLLRIEGEKADLWTNRKYVFLRARGKRFFLPVRRVPVPRGDEAKYPRGGTVSLLNALRDALASGAPAETRGEDNIRSLAMVEAARISHMEGRRVRIAEVLPEQRGDV